VIAHPQLTINQYGAVGWILIVQQLHTDRAIDITLVVILCYLFHKLAVLLNSIDGHIQRRKYIWLIVSFLPEEFSKKLLEGLNHRGQRDRVGEFQFFLQREPSACRVELLYFLDGVEAEGEQLSAAIAVVSAVGRQERWEVGILWKIAFVCRAIDFLVLKIGLSPTSDLETNSNSAVLDRHQRNDVRKVIVLGFPVTGLASIGAMRYYLGFMFEKIILNAWRGLEFRQRLLFGHPIAQLNDAVDHK